MQTVQAQQAPAYHYGQPPTQQPPQQGPSVAEMVRSEQSRQEVAEARAERNNDETNQAINEKVLSQRSDIDTDRNGIISLAEAIQARGKNANEEMKSLIQEVLRLHEAIDGKGKQSHGADSNGNLVANANMPQNNQAMFGGINITA